MSESVNDKLERVRKPAVHIKCEVETEGAKIAVDLPFVVGVMGDFTGNKPAKKLESLEKRKFIQVDKENFNKVLERLAPGVEMEVENTIEGDDKMMNLELEFKSMEDFEPGQVVQNVEPLRRLLETRNRLRDLIGKAQRSEELEGVLEEVLKNTEEMKKLASELGVEVPPDDAE